MGRDKIALLFAILLTSSYAMELQHAARCDFCNSLLVNPYFYFSSAGRQLSPDPLTNALGIGFMTVAMIDGIHKIQVIGNNDRNLIIEHCKSNKLVAIWHGFTFHPT